MSIILSLSIYWTSMVVIFIAASVFLKKLENRKADKDAIKVVVIDHNQLISKINRKD